MVAGILLVGASLDRAGTQHKPEGEMRWALYIWPSAVGPRVAEPALLLIDPYPWSTPLEDVRLKPR